MSPMTLYIVSAILFVLGLAAIGGATFGRKRTPRLVLAAAGIALWAATLVLYSQAVSGSTGDAVTPPASESAVTEPPAAGESEVTQAPAAGESEVIQAPAASESDITQAAEAGPDLPGRLAFHSARSGSYEIYSMNGDGTDLRQLTETGGRGDIEPDYSPDGTTIAFSSSRDHEYLVQLYVMDADGGNQRRLMDPVAGDQLGARWSPDGEWIAFYSNVDGNLEVYKVRKDATDLTNLSNHENNDYMPYWSPEGERLVFVSERDGNRELYVMNSDGSNQVRLTNNFFDDVQPRWSPDGTSLLFTSTRDGLDNLYLMDAPPEDVAGPIDQDVDLLTFPGFNDATPAWAAGGTLIVFSSDRNSPETGENWELFVMTADGSQVRQLTDDPEPDRFPTWTP